MKRISFTTLFLFLLGTLLCTTLEVGIGSPYQTITSAIQAAVPGDVVRVHDGIYQENLTIDKGITIISDYYYDHNPAHIENTKISSTGPNETILFNAKSPNVNITFAGFTIEGTSSAVKLESGSEVDVMLMFCEIYAHDTREVEIVQALSTTSLDMKNCRVNAAHGKAIRSAGANLSVYKCEIGSNSDTGIQFDGDGMGTLDVERTVFYSNNTGIEIRSPLGTATLDHVTIADNVKGVKLHSGDLAITNSIIFFNGTQIQHAGGTYEVSHSDIEGGHAGERNINYDPLFDPGDNGTYDLRWDQYGKSPCIDAASRYSVADPDGTPGDMGAYHAICHRFDMWGFPTTDKNGGWRWFCIPAVDDVLQNPAQNTAEALFGGMIDLDILDQLSWSASGSIDKVSLIGGEWTNLDHVVTPTQGYKIHMNEKATIGYDLEVPGFNPPFNTVIPLDPSEDKWVGYFLPETRLAVDLFDDIKNNINWVKAQRWALSRVDGEWVGDTDVSLSYGDMVIISVNQSCNFQWDTHAQITDPEAYPFPEHFDFVEKAEYIPFFVEYTPVFQNEEIAVVIDGKIKGAAVVFESLTQINGYLADDDEDGYEGGSHMGEVDFIIWCPVRGETRKIDDYYVYNESLRKVVHSKIEVSDKRDYYYVSFDDESVIDASPAMALTHYPNPFNPETTISYTLDHEDEVAVDIYNVRGQKVRTLVRGSQDEGSYQVTWSGDDASGKPVSSGVYFCRLKSGEETIVRKMMLMK